MSLGRRIRLYRKERGYTQGELAEILGVSVQSVSKWETDSGMPDIAQIVPLSKTLGVSTDILLGNTEEDISAVISEIDNFFNREFCSSISQAKEIYSKSKPYFDRHPTNPKLAYFCLQSFSVLINSDEFDDSFAAINELNRYMNCIEKYETDTDCLFRSYYVMSNALRMLGAEDEAEKMMKRIPDTFGDKQYWEAEVEFYNGNWEKALAKCKESFAIKARYVSRCIRLARWISEKTKGNDGLREQLNYSKYMLTMIDAFLSGGDYLPHRMMYQKISLLCGMVDEHIKLKEYDDALNCAQLAADAWSDFKKVQKCPEKFSSLMFDKNYNDGWRHITDEKFNEYWRITIERLKNVKEIRYRREFESLEEFSHTLK